MIVWGLTQILCRRPSQGFPLKSENDETWKYLGASKIIVQGMKSSHLPEQSLSHRAFPRVVLCLFPSWKSLPGAQIRTAQNT